MANEPKHRLIKSLGYFNNADEFGEAEVNLDSAETGNATFYALQVRAGDQHIEVYISEDTYDALKCEFPLGPYNYRGPALDAVFNTIPKSEREDALDIVKALGVVGGGAVVDKLSSI